MNNNVSQVNRTSCFGCSACMAICKCDAITMKPDEEGFMVPEIDENKCIDCGMCIKTCAAINRYQPTFNGNKYYAYQHNSESTLERSTSGGAFSAIIDESKTPYVCGCITDENLYVKHILSFQQSDIEAMQGSKYVQSDMSNCFREIRKTLLQGNRVVFTGTSCQVDGLKRYLSLTNVSQGNLVTMDLICHGVPSNLMHKEYVKLYEDKKKTTAVSHLFRSKRNGWGSKFILRNYEQLFMDNKEINDYQSLESQLWLNVFFSDLCLRESCYNCPYCTEHKPADYTVADFWGGEETTLDVDFSKGCSLVIARNNRREVKFKSGKLIELNDEQKEIAQNHQAHLKKPISRPNKRDDFWSDYYSYGFLYVARKYFRYDYKHVLMLKLFNFYKNRGWWKKAERMGHKLFY